MRDILMSLKPYYYYLIGEGIKKIEVRKHSPKANDWSKTTWLYMSKDEKSFAKIPKKFQEKYREHFGKVGLKFVCDKIYDISAYDEFYGTHYGWNFDFSLSDTCLTEKEFEKYFSRNINGYIKPINGYGWHISDLKIYDKPKELAEFKKECPKENAINGSCAFCPYSYFERQHVIPSCNAILTRPPQSCCYVEQ